MHVYVKSARTEADDTEAEDHTAQREEEVVVGFIWGEGKLRADIIARKKTCMEDMDA